VCEINNERAKRDYEAARRPNVTSNVRFRLSLFLLIVTNAWSQTSGTGSIQGIVTDPMDAVVPGARVTATNALTGVVSEATTTEAGRYVIPLLKPGPYNVTFTSAGFAVVTEKNIVVDALAAVAVNAKLSANTVSDVVTVTGEQPHYRQKTFDWAPRLRMRPTILCRWRRTNPLAIPRPSLGYLWE